MLWFRLRLRSCAPIRFVGVCKSLYLSLLQIRQKAPSVMVSTIAQASFLENISCIFGHKIVDYLAPLDLALPHGKITG